MRGIAIHCAFTVDNFRILTPTNVGLTAARFAEALTGKRSAVDRLLAIVGVLEHYVDTPTLPGGCPILNTAIEADDAYPTLRERAQAAMTSWHTLIGSTVKAGVQRGELRPAADPRVVAAVLTAGMEGALMLSKLYGDPIYMRRMAEHLALARTHGIPIIAVGDALVHAPERKDVLAATGGKQVPWDHSALTGDFYFQKVSAPGGLRQVQPATPDGTQERLRQLEEQLKQKTSPQQTADMVELAQARERLRSLEQANKADQKRIFDTQMNTSRSGDAQARANLSFEIGGIQMQIGRRVQEIRTLRERIAKLEETLGLKPAGAENK